MLYQKLKKKKEKKTKEEGSRVGEKYEEIWER